MELRSLLLTIGAMAVILLLTPVSIGQSTSSVIYGYVSVGSVPTNGITVTLSNAMSGQTVTANDENGKPGYYRFDIVNGSDYIVTAGYNGYSDHNQSHVSRPSVRMDLHIPLSTPTPAPTVTVTPTPTPRPSDEIGGVVRHNNDSSFTPLSATKPSPTPLPRSTPTPAPTTVQNATAVPTPIPVVGTFSNPYIWLVIALVAILSILAIAVAAFLFWRAK